MKSSIFLIVLFSILVAPTVILGNASKANACDPLNPLCQKKETLQIPPLRAESEVQSLKKLGKEEALDRAKATADRAKQDEINAKNEHLAAEELAVIEKAKAEEKGERIAAINNERAKLMIEMLRVRPDVQNISLQIDPNRKLTGVCHEQKEFSHTQVSHDNANHPSAYNDGYREGRMSTQRREKYSPRTGGGEFSRGFDDGYYGNKSTGQNANATVKDSAQAIYKWNEKCAAIIGKKAIDRAKANTESAKISIATFSSRSDVRNISLQTDPNRKLTGVCYEQQEILHTQVYHDNANHPSAYNDGYREGRMSTQRREKYSPRTGGGEFSRGFDDGYYGNKSTGQDANATVKDSSQAIYNWNEKCAAI
jgi:glucan-binding YG repeat protein